MRVDMAYIERKKEFLTRKIDYLEQELYTTPFFKQWEEFAGGKVNINSNPQLSKFLYNKGGLNLPIKVTTESGQGSTDKDTLTQLNIPALNLMLEIRKIKKIRDTYLDAFAREQVDGYVHPVFNLHLVRTYRSSSDSPNFQNIPKRDVEGNTKRTLSAGTKGNPFKITEPAVGCER